MYARYGKRTLDLALCLAAGAALLPLYAVLAILGAFAMKGNPFFVQERPGRNEEIFRLVKFRTMTNARDTRGRLLSDDARLTRYGRFLRSTSLDELPELWNVLRGEMALVGPRPLLVEYLPYYTPAERRRHDVRPGLTGLAQIHGRNAIGSWEERFGYDLEYVSRFSFALDAKILFQTAVKVIRRSDILAGGQIHAGRLDEARRRAGRDSNAA